MTGKIVATRSDAWIVNGEDKFSYFEDQHGAKRVHGIYFVDAAKNWWFATRYDGWKKLDPKPCPKCGRPSVPFDHCGKC